MKKLIVALAFLAINLLNAQTKFGIGTRAGVAINTFSDNNSENKDPFTTYEKPITLNLAVVSEASFTKNFSLQGELAFTETQSNVKYNDGFNKWTSKFDASYLGLNAIPKAKIVSGNFEAFAMAGFSFNVNLVANAKATLTSQFQSYDATWNARNQINKATFTGIAGVGFAYKISTLKFFIDQRYTHSFTDLYENNQVKSRINQLTINLGFISEF